MIRSQQRPALRNWLVVALATGQMAVFQLAAETVTQCSGSAKIIFRADQSLAAAHAALEVTRGFVP